MTARVALTKRVMALVAGALLAVALAVPVALAAGEKAEPIGLVVKAFEPARMYQCKDQPTDTGAVVTAVTPDSSADKLGVKPGAIILEVNRQMVDGPEDVHRLVEKALAHALRDGGTSSDAAIGVKVCLVANRGKQSNLVLYLNCKYEPYWKHSWPGCPYVDPSQRPPR